jgi:membrane protein YqaA with SNARE-associated domain
MTTWAGFDLAVAAGLFASGLGSATFLPGQSEAVLTALLLTSKYTPWFLVAAASAGNVLGSAINWLLGRAVERFRDRKWFPVKPAALERAQGWYQRYGKWSLLLSWAPVIGDPLTLVAGVLREPLPVFLLLVGIAKTARYAVLAWIVLSWG